MRMQCVQAAGVGCLAWAAALIAAPQAAALAPQAPPEPVVLNAPPFDAVGRESDWSSNPRFKTRFIKPRFPREAACGAETSPLLEGSLPTIALYRVAQPGPSELAADREFGRELPASVKVTFVINAQGRPMTIRTDAPPRVSTYDTSEPLGQRLEAEIARWRFPAHDLKEKSCAIAIELPQQDLAEITAPEALEMLARPLPAGALATELWGRLETRNRECWKRNRLVDHWPDFERVVAPGRREWAAIRHAITRSGHIQDAEVEASSGSAVFNAAALRARMASRVAAGEETVRDCIFLYWGGALALIPPPSLLQPVPEESQACAQAVAIQDAALLRNLYPRVAQQRFVEGVAVIGYDLAPWGAIGNARILQSEPISSFGAAAKSYVERIKFSNPDRVGAVDCRVVVRFLLAN